MEILPACRRTVHSKMFLEKEIREVEKDILLLQFQKVFLSERERVISDVYQIAWKSLSVVSFRLYCSQLGLD